MVRCARNSGLRAKSHAIAQTIAPASAGMLAASPNGVIGKKTREMLRRISPGPSQRPRTFNHLQILRNMPFPQNLSPAIGWSGIKIQYGAEIGLMNHFSVADRLDNDEFAGWLALRLVPTAGT